MAAHGWGCTSPFRFRRPAQLYLIYPASSNWFSLDVSGCVSVMCLLGVFDGMILPCLNVVCPVIAGTQPIRHYNSHGIITYIQFPVFVSSVITPASAQRCSPPHRKDQKKVDKLEAQIPYHEGRGNKEEVEKIKEQVAAIWAKTREAAMA